MTKCANINSESKISDLIYIFDDLLDGDKCDEMVQWYRDNPDLHKQLVGNAGYEHQLDLETLRGNEATLLSDNPLSDVLTEVCLKA